MRKTIEVTSMFGTKATITFNDNYEYIRWGNKITCEKKIDKLPKTDTAYKALVDFKGATSVMAMSDSDYKRCIIYERKSPRCSTWSASFCKLN